MHVGILRQKYVIQPSFSPWSSPVVMIKNDGSWGFCVDYRKLNSVTHRDAYPVPRIDSTLAGLYTVKIRVLLQHPIKIEICVGCYDSTEGV